jgi:molecular chaperone HscC
VLRSLRDSSIRSEQLSEVLLVGGATRMPVVRRAVTRMFGRFPSTRLDPDQAVALGAAVQAGLKARDAALEEVRLTDVCPFTLGIEVSEREAGGGRRDGIFAPIIERNTVVPASRVETFSTMQNGQRQVEIKVYQGEARTVAANVLLGRINVPVPPALAGTVAVDCRFSYDSSGLLEVDVTVPKTGMTHQLVICDDEDAPTEAELAQRRNRLAALKVHPREDVANAAALARAERCYEMFLGERREFVGALISSFRNVVERQDPRAIDAARLEMEAALDELEGERFL